MREKIPAPTSARHQGARTDEIREYALKSILDLKSLFRSVTQKTKVKLAQHVKELVLTPGKRDGEDVYQVAGE